MSEIPRFDCKCGHTAMEHFATSTTPEDGPMKPTWCITCGSDKCGRYESAATSQIETRHPLLIRAENAEQASADHLKELERLRERNRYLLDENDWLESAVSAHEGEAAYALERSALLATANVELDALRAQLRRGPCCKEPDYCGGECTCQICAPDLAIRDLEALLADSREANAALEAQLRSKDEQLAGMREALGNLIHALDTCHICGGSLEMPTRGAAHCEDCSSGCESQDPPDCASLEEVVSQACAALSGPSPAQEGTE